MFKRGLLTLLICLSSMNVYALEIAEQPKEREYMFLECKYTKEYVTGYVSSMDLELADPAKWQITSKKSYYFVPFGTSWEEVEDTCYAHQVYIESAIYTRADSYVEKDECLDTPHKRGRQMMRYMTGSYFLIDSANRYHNGTNTCNIHVKYTVITNPPMRIDWSGRKSCKLAKQHYYNGIRSKKYRYELDNMDILKETCKQIDENDFVRKTNLSVNELYDIVAKDIVNGVR